MMSGKYLQLYLRANLAYDGSTLMMSVHCQTFKARASEIADQAHNPRGALGDGAEFLRGLDETERQLFKAAHEGPKAVKAWTQDQKKHV